MTGHRRQRVDTVGEEENCDISSSTQWDRNCALTDDRRTVGPVMFGWSDWIRNKKITRARVCVCRNRADVMWNHPRIFRFFLSSLVHKMMRVKNLSTRKTRDDRFGWWWGRRKWWTQWKWFDWHDHQQRSKEREREREEGKKTNPTALNLDQKRRENVQFWRENEEQGLAKVVNVFFLPFLPLSYTFFIFRPPSLHISKLSLFLANPVSAIGTWRKDNLILFGLSRTRWSKWTRHFWLNGACQSAPLSYLRLSCTGSHFCVCVCVDTTNTQ